MPHTIKDQFPIFKKHPELIYLDNAATTQKPQAVLDALISFYTDYNANIHRGVYSFAEEATEQFERARATIAAYIGADPDEIVFVKNATEGINLVAYSWANEHIKAHDRIVLTEYEHHANLLPWQRVAKQRDAALSYIPVDEQGLLRYDALEQAMHKATLVAFSAVSNVTGAYADVASIGKAAHAAGAKVLIDASQWVAHEQINVKELNVDFLVFSGHKLYGPTGIGILYIKKERQQEMVPYQLGGGIVFDVDMHETKFLQGQRMFEAGTPPIAQAIGLAAAINWLQHESVDKIKRHEGALIERCISGLQELPRVHILGDLTQLKQQGSLVSFVLPQYHAHDVAAYLNQSLIAVRAGHHCAQPFAKKLNIDASVRVSVAAYNTEHEIKKLVKKLHELMQ